MGRIWKKVLSWTLCLMMAAGMLPGITRGAKAVDYIDSSDLPPMIAPPTILGTTPFEENTTICITCDTTDVSIYYTTDGSEPNESSTSMLYTAPITITQTTTVKAVAKLDSEESLPTEKTFTKSESIPSLVQSPVSFIAVTSSDDITADNIGECSSSDAASWLNTNFAAVKALVPSGKSFVIMCWKESDEVKCYQFGATSASVPSVATGANVDGLIGSYNGSGVVYLCDKASSSTEPTNTIAELNDLIDEAENLLAAMKAYATEHGYTDQQLNSLFDGAFDALNTEMSSFTIGTYSDGNALLTIGDQILYNTILNLCSTAKQKYEDVGVIYDPDKVYKAGDSYTVYGGVYYKNDQGQLSCLRGANGWDVFETYNITDITVNNGNVEMTVNGNDTIAMSHTGISAPIGFRITGQGTRQNPCEFVAVYETHTVVYDANAGSGTVPTDSNQYEVGSTVTLKPYTGLTKTNFECIGWNTDPNATTALVSLTIGTEDVKLFAVWKKTEESPAVIPAALTITAESAEKAYDGSALTKDSYIAEGLAEGDKVEDITITGSQTIAGSSNNVPSAAKIVNAKGEDVTAAYDITYVNGTLTVTKAALPTLTNDQKPAPATDLKEDGKDQVLVINPKTLPDGYTVEYSTDGGKTWKTVPTGKDSGEYLIQVQYKAKDENHTDFFGEDLKVLIAGEYNPTEGSGEWTKGSKTACVFRFKKAFNDEVCFVNFTGVFIDGKEAQKDKDYTATKGSTIITFAPEFLETLSTGEHMIKITFKDGESSAVLKVLAPAADTTPTTGDTSMPVLWAMLILISMVGTAVLIEKKRREA